MRVPTRTMLAVVALQAGACGGTAHTLRHPLAAPEPTRDEAIVAALADALPPFASDDASAMPPARTAGCGRFTAEDPFIRARVEAGTYVEIEVTPYRVRLAANEARTMAPYLGDLLARAHETLVVRYGSVPRPVRIDLYDAAAAFVARVGAVASIDLDGASCGDAVAARSPAGGAGNWGATLLHELAHVHQEGLARGRAPRWLSEGSAELDTRRARREWRRELEGTLSEVLLDGAGDGPLDRLSRALEGSTTTRTRGLAYATAAELVAFLELRYGHDVPARLLARYGEGDDDDAAMRHVLGVGADAIESAFLEHIRPRLEAEASARLPTPADAATDGSPTTRAVLALLAGRLAEAREAAELALSTGNDDPPRTKALALYVRARIAMLDGDARAEQLLRAMTEAGGGAYEVHVALARAALRRGDAARAAQDVEAAIAIAPERLAAWDVCLALDGRGGVRHEREVCAARVAEIDERARDVTLALLAEAVARSDWSAARELGERLVYVAPDVASVHEALARTYDALDEPALAARERQVLVAMRRGSAP